MAIQTPTENWFKFPNHIADNLHTYEANDLKVLVLILRRTVGMLGLTPNPDQRFSISFIAKKCDMSENTARTVKKRLLERGDIKQDGTASDGSPLYSIVWDTPKFEVGAKSEEETPQNLREEGMQNLDPDKDISLKTIDTKTLDASASSAAHKDHDKNLIEAINRGEIKVERIQIPYKEISDYFLAKHREFRKVKDEKYMPKWGPKEQKAVKRIYQSMIAANENGSIYHDLTKEKILQAFKLTTEAFLSYLKDCGKTNYALTTPILPSQLTEPVFNRILPYIQKLETAPKLEIKSYENKGRDIGPMPEGW